MLKHILAAIDFSPAWPQLRAQLHRLPALGCQRITLAYVMESGYGHVPETSHREHYEARLAAETEELAAATGLTVDWTLRSGPVVPELLAAAIECGAETVLAGSQGHGKVYDLLLGSVALDLARRANRPLLLAPVVSETPPVAGPVCRPLLATDGSAAATGAEAAFLRLLPHCRPGVAVSVGHWDDDSTAEAEHARLQSHLEGLKARAEGGEFETRLVGHGYPSETISRLARETEADLVILGRRGHNPLAELLLGSTAEAVCRQGQQLVLLVPADA